MSNLLKRFEAAIVYSLIVMMVIVIALSTVDLGWKIVQNFLTPPYFLFSVDGLLDIFGFFLLILIGVELLETIKAYLQDHVVHVEVVLEVALIAIARKVIILDVKDYSSATILGIAALILALAAAFFIEKHSRLKLTASGGEHKPPERPEGTSTDSKRS